MQNRALYFIFLSCFSFSYAMLKHMPLTQQKKQAIKNGIVLNKMMKWYVTHSILADPDKEKLRRICNLLEAFERNLVSVLPCKLQVTSAIFSEKAGKALLKKLKEDRVNLDYQLKRLSHRKQLNISSTTDSLPSIKIITPKENKELAPVTPSAPQSPPLPSVKTALATLKVPKKLTFAL